MIIESYSFGRIKIDGQQYTSDVIIFENRVKSSWWRKEGHKLHLQDLDEVLAVSPDILVIGTGKSGLMMVPDEVKNALKEKRIEPIIEKTDKAVKIYNERRGENTVAALHLTC